MLFRSKPPSWEHWFGTDALGRDVFARTLLGGRISLIVGLVSALFCTVIGLLIGSMAGYFRRFDFPIMRVVDVIMSFPLWILLLLAAAFVGPGIVNIIVLIALITWPVPARIIRGQILQMREADFVMAAKVLGAKDQSILVRHVLPNSIAPVFVSVAFGVAGAVLVETSLSFLGFGDANVPSWGEIVSQGRQYVIEGLDYLVIWPGVAIFVTLTAFNLFGQGLRDAMDPRLRR